MRKIFVVIVFLIGVIFFTGPPIQIGRWVNDDILHLPTSTNVFYFWLVGFVVLVCMVTWFICIFLLWFIAEDIGNWIEKKRKKSKK